MTTKPPAPEGLQVRYQPLDSLVPYTRNARTHSDEQVAQLAGSMREFGWTVPILVDEENGVIGGHGRMMAARKLGMTEVPTIELRNLTPIQKRAYILADNRLAEQAGWDEKLLALNLEELQIAEFDLQTIGFSDEELAQLLLNSDHGTGETDEDEIPAEQEVAISQSGELWLLGKHRLLCGDAANADDVGKLLGDSKPILMVTDPPYGVAYDPEWRNRDMRSDGSVLGARSVGQVANDDNASWLFAWQLFPGDVVYVWHASLQTRTVAVDLEEAGFKLYSLIVWAKQHFSLSRGHYHWQHELCWYGVRNTKKGHWVSGRKQSTIWNIQSGGAFGGNIDDGKTDHSTQKPVECMRRPIENNSNPGQMVYDPFIGSGTTIIAAETVGRACLGIEIMPQYVDMAIRRWQNFTGEQAIREDGKTFAELEAETAK